MTKTWADGLPIRVEAVDAQGVPASFGWQGQAHAVERLVQRWEVETDWWSEEGETRRLFVTVITKTGMLCVLFCDLPTVSGGFRGSTTSLPSPAQPSPPSLAE